MDVRADEMLDHYPPVLKLRSESGSENVHYSVLYEGFPDEFRLMAEKELSETDEKRKKGMQKLKEVMKRENMHISNDIYLLAVLRCCKYNLKKAETKLKKFVVAYRQITVMAAKLDLSKVEDIIDDLCFGIIPYRDKHGRFIIYTRPYGFHQEKYSLEEAGTLMLVTTLFLLSFPITTVTGLVYFADCKSPSLSIFYPIFKLFRSLVPCFLATPMRIRRAEILDSFTLIRWFYKLSSVFISDKLLKRAVFHTSNYENLYKDYERGSLPDTFGGTLGPLSSKFYKQRLLDFIKKMKDEYQEIGS